MSGLQSSQSKAGVKEFSKNPSGEQTIVSILTWTMLCYTWGGLLRVWFELEQSDICAGYTSSICACPQILLPSSKGAVSTLYISEAIYSNASLGQAINSNYIIHQWSYL